MLYVNEEQVYYANSGRDENGNFKFINSTAKDNPNSIWIAECIEKIQAKKTIGIRMCESLRTLNKAATSNPENRGRIVYDWPESRPLEITATIERNGRNELWRWSERPREGNEHKGYKYSPHRSINFGALYNSVPPTKRFKKSETELVFFFENVSLQKGTIFEFIDEVKSVRVGIEEKRTKALLFSILPDMDNSLDDSIIPELAEAYCVTGVEDLLDQYKEGGMDVVRDRLYTAVEARFNDPADRMAVETFKSLVKGGQRQLRAAITKAIDKGIIKLI